MNKMNLHNIQQELTNAASCTTL